MAGQPAGGPRYSSPEENAAAQRRHRRRGTLITAVAALVAIAVGVAVWWNLQPDDERRVDGMNHTTLVSCEVDDEGLAVATVSVTNTSDTYSNYIVDIAFTNAAGEQVERRTLNILGVDTDQTAEDSVTTREPVEGDGGDVDCRIRSAFRLFAGAAPRD
jgi:hypothetical protein